MSLKEIWVEQEAYTKLASDTARQFSLAGVAIVWLFKVEAKGSVHLDPELLDAAISFVAALGFDFLQYVVGACVFLALGYRRESLSGAAKDADYSVWILRPIDFFFFVKLIAVFVGYVILLHYLFSKIQ